MPRRPNTLPTEIYWLLDVRPETIANGYQNGYPFYCGKTIFSAEKRLVEHRHVANTHPHRGVSKWIAGCGKHIRVQIMETVPADKDWAERERWWIKTIRLLWPLSANTTAGGQGAIGLVHPRGSVERRAAKHKGLKRTPETRAKIGAASKGRKWSPESVERQAAKMRGKKWTPERHERAAARHLINKNRQNTKREDAAIRIKNVKQRQNEFQHVIEPQNAQISLIC